MSARDDLLRRLGGRRGPSDADLQGAWERLPQREQDRLRRIASDPGAAHHLHDDLARTLVDSLAADRANRQQWDVAVPVLTALLVFSTIWGFGRAVLPDVAGWFLLLGVVAGLMTTVIGWRRGARARQGAREVRRVLRRR